MGQKGKFTGKSKVYLNRANGANIIPIDYSDKQVLNKIRERFGINRNAQRQNFGWLNPDYRQSVLGSMEKAIAKPEEFMPFPFRHITATIVGAGSWKCTEFTEKSLKEARSLFQYNPSLVNHEAEISNIIGQTGLAEFTKAFTAADGTHIPAGIDAPIWVDMVLHTDICRMLTGYPMPHIQSVSIGVVYEWEASHEFTDITGNINEYAFMDRIGTMVDGEMVRRIVTKILSVDETSLVFMGADPFAKILVGGEPFKVEKWCVVGENSFAKDPLANYYKESNTMFLMEDAERISTETLYLSKSSTTYFSKSGKQDSSMKLTLFGKKEDYSAEHLQALLDKGFEVAFKEVQADATLTQELTKAKEDLTKANTDLTAEAAKLKTATDELTTAKDTLKQYAEIIPADQLAAFGKDEIPLKDVIDMAKMGKSELKAKHDFCLKMYRLKAGQGKAQEAIEKSILESNGEKLDAFIKDYAGSAYTAFGASCSKCGSNDIKLNSSVNPEGDGKEGASDEGHTDLLGTFRR